MMMPSMTATKTKSANEDRTQTANIPMFVNPLPSVRPTPKGFHFRSATSKPMGIRGADGRCKFSHSVKDYLEQKEKTIGDVCPVFEVIGVRKDE